MSALHKVHTELQETRKRQPGRAAFSNGLSKSETETLHSKLEVDDAAYDKHIYFLKDGGPVVARVILAIPGIDIEIGRSKVLVDAETPIVRISIRSAIAFTIVELTEERGYATVEHFSVKASGHIPKLSIAISCRTRIEVR